MLGEKGRRKTTRYWAKTTHCTRANTAPFGREVYSMCQLSMTPRSNIQSPPCQYDIEWGYWLWLQLAGVAMRLVIGLCL